MTSKFILCQVTCSGGLRFAGSRLFDFRLLLLAPSLGSSSFSGQESPMLQSERLASGASSCPSQKPVFGFRNQITKFVVSLWNKSPWILNSTLRASPDLSIWSLRHTLSRLFFFFLTCFLFPCYFLNKWNYEVLHLIGRIFLIYLDVSFGGTLSVKCVCMSIGRRERGNSSWT